MARLVIAAALIAAACTTAPAPQHNSDTHTLDLQGHTLAVSGSADLADGAHVVAVAPATHRTFYPIPAGTNGRAALLERAPS